MSSETLRLKKYARIINQYVNDGKLLDIGCNDKEISNFLNGKIDYHGIDYPAVDLEKDKLPFPDKSFNYISCLDVLEHLKSQANAVNEIKRIIKDDGLIFISLPNVCHFFNRFMFLFGREFEDVFIEKPKSKHYHHPSVRQNIAFIEKHFKILKIYYFGNFLYNYKNLNKIPLDWMARLYPKLFAYATFFICKKSEKNLSEQKFLRIRLKKVI